MKVARKLRAYFQAYTLIVLTTQPLHLIFLKPDISRIMVRWLIELIEFDLKFQLRTTIKAQALVDFIVK